MLLAYAEEARNYLYMSKTVVKVDSKVALIMGNGLFLIESITDLFRYPYRMMG